MLGLCTCVDCTLDALDMCIHDAVLCNGFFFR